MPTISPAELDYGDLVRQARRVAPDTGRETVRVALLGSCALQYFVPMLRALFSRVHLGAELYDGGFDTADTEVHDPGSRLYAFAPDVVVLLDPVQSFVESFLRAGDDRSPFVEGYLARVSARWDAIARRSRAIVVQTNLAAPLERTFGNFEAMVPGSLAETVSVVNREIVARARASKSVFLCDVDNLASYVGRRSWFDDKLWVLGKGYCALEHLPLVAKNIVDVALASRGVGVKCVVVDLDNTLWGGVIGDDGLDGIRIGHLGDGEAYSALQRFLLELTRRGVLLAVCSKNDRENALLPFREHPEMVLREPDITVFMANWEDKATNLARIRETLNIGFDTMVFLDDNPFERNLVRELLPEVLVPELPEDPAGYVKAVCELNLFETSSSSSLDRERGQLYRSAALREEAKARFQDIDDYLRSLDMKITLRRFSERDLSRVAQLIQRSNQFNLATRRFTEAECDAMLRDVSGYYPFAAELRDRFGDHGLIGVVVLRIVGDVAYVDELLMSCRVLSRGVEQYVMNHLFEAARARGLSRVEGVYAPTKKNAMVEDFYPRFGFEPMGVDAAGATRWTLAVAAYVPRPTHIIPCAGDAATAA